jgi:hypothetical protein
MKALRLRDAGGNRKGKLTDEVDELVLADSAAGDDEHAGEDAGEVWGGRHGQSNPDLSCG